MPAALAASRKRLLAATTRAETSAGSGSVATAGSRWPRWTSIVSTAGRTVSTPRLTRVLSLLIVAPPVCRADRVFRGTPRTLGARLLRAHPEHLAADLLGGVAAQEH